MTLLLAVHLLLACLAPLLCRPFGHRAFFAVALAPAAAFVWCLLQAPAVLSGGVVTETAPWIPALGVDLSVRVGVLQWVLALVVSGIGALVLIYCRWYFDAGEVPARTAGIMVAFAGAMLGLVTSDNLLSLYVYWELTTVFSYLLVGHNPTRSANRRAALTALMVTTFGGLSMLVGIVILGTRAGTYSISAVLDGPIADDHSIAVVVAVLLLLVGALSKSALVPFHFWLPGAMAAPTPVSAYLHAAAMVKAGVYLVALLSPAFADLPGWRPTIMLLGAATMLLGGWRALRQFDIKLLLAYGTVSQLGFMIVLCGLGTRSAQLAGLALLISHALFKSALFLVVGVVDTRTGTRDLRRLSGVGRAMPAVAAAALVAGASMAGVPPTLGFTTKESAFASLGYLVLDGDGTQVPAVPALLLAAALVAGSALTVAYTLRFVWGAFAVKETVVRSEVGRAGLMGAVPILLAAGTLAGGLAGYPLTAGLRPWADVAPVGEPSHGISLWQGLGAPLAMSVVALVVGAGMFLLRQDVARLQSSLPHVVEAEQVYQRLMRGLDRLGVEVTARTQSGSLPIYLGVILLVVVAIPGGVLLVVDDWPGGWRVADHPAQVLVGSVMIIAAFLAATSRGRLKAVILVGVTGYGTALLFVLHGAPDLALTQVLVETVTLVVFVLVLRKLPKYFTNRPLHVTRWWRLVIAALLGLTVTGLTLLAAGSRVATPVSQAYYQAAYSFGYGKNIVNVTLVDIRAWDTMGELSVLVVAATGVASLIFIRRRYIGERPPVRVDQARREGRSEVRHPQNQPSRVVWLRGTEALSPLRRSIVFEVITRLLFPVMIVSSVYLLWVGHNAPGGGFAGGLIAGLALIIRYLAGGRDELDEAAPVDAGRVLGVGLLVAAASILWPFLIGGRIGQSYDFYLRLPWLEGVVLPWGAPLVGEFKLVTSLFFDIGVYLVVIGVMLDLARSLGAGIDQHESDNRTPSPVTSGPRARTVEPGPAKAGVS